jgi:hypothetical protein
MKTKDPVMNNEARYDRMCEASEIQHERNMAYAQTEYESGELNDSVESDSDPHDNFMLAHALVQWLDSGTPVEKLMEWMPVCSLKDFRASVEGTIQDHAKLMGDS